MIKELVAGRCAKRVYGGVFSGNQCLNKATKDGWCGIHHPNAEKRRAEKSEALSKARMARVYARIDAQTEQARKAAMYDDLASALQNLIGWVPGPEAWHTDAPMKAVEQARAALRKCGLIGEGKS